MEWDYAELSKMAKANGGPEALVKILIQSGVAKGKESMYPVAALALVVGAAVWEGGKFIFKKVCMHSKSKPSEADVQLAKTELIAGIQKYDAEHPDNQQEITNEEGKRVANLRNWNNKLKKEVFDLEANTDRLKCPRCGKTINFVGHDEKGDFPYGEGYWECPSCGFKITEAELQPKS